MKNVVSIIAALLFIAVASNASAVVLGINIFENDPVSGLAGGSGFEIMRVVDTEAEDFDGCFIIPLDVFLTDDVTDLNITIGATEGPSNWFVGVTDDVTVATGSGFLATENAGLINTSFNGVQGQGKTEYTINKAENAFQNFFFERPGSTQLDIPTEGAESTTFSIYEYVVVPGNPFLGQPNTFTITDTTIDIVVATSKDTVVPVPAAFLLMATGLLGLVGLRKN